MSSKTFRGLGGSGPGSKLAEAFRQVASAAGSSGASGLFGQVRRLTINNTLILQSTSEFDIDFEVPFDDDPEINEATITLYNLAPTTLNQLVKDAIVTLEAGYEKDSVGQILSGRIIKVKSSWEDLDHVTELTVQDYQGVEDTKLQDISYPAGTAASKILTDLSARLAIPIAVFQLARDHVFESAVKINGSLMDGIRKYASVCGVHAWINKSNLYICALDVPMEEGYFDLNANTGLLSVEEWQETETLEQTEAEKNAGQEARKETINGCTLKMLLQHRVYTGCTIQVTSKNVNGRFRVREGQHTGSDDEFVTEVKAVRMGG